MVPCRCLLLLACVLTMSCCHKTAAVFTTRQPWCFNGHLHIHPLSEAKKYMGLEPNQEFTDIYLQRQINDSFHRVGCDLIAVPDVDCCQSMTPENIYDVLNLPLEQPLEEDNYMKSSVIITSWLYQLEDKCIESKSMNWSILSYKDFVHDIIDRFQDDDHDDEDHEEELFGAVALENLVRSIDDNYKPGGNIGDNDMNKTVVCSSPNSWYIMSREIWRDLHLEHEEGIAEDEMSEMSSILLLYVLHGYCFVRDRIVENQLPPEGDFIKHLFLEFGDSETCTIDEEGFDEILDLLHIGDDGHTDHSTSTNTQPSGVPSPLEDQDHDHSGPYGYPVSERCLDSHELQDTFDLHLHDHPMSREDFLLLCPALVQQSTQGCLNQHSHSSASKPSDAAIYGFGTLSVFIISLVALLGLIVVRWNKTPTYKYIITTMLGLAAGSLVGDVLLHLIPHALGLHDHSDDGHDHSADISNIQVEPFIWKMLCACGSVWLFFLLQVGLMKTNDLFVKKKLDTDVISTKVEHLNGTLGGSTNKGFSSSDEPQLVKMKEIPEVNLKDELADCKNHKTAEMFCSDHCVILENLKNKTPEEVAWMATVGDAVHNLADGLTIGASFSSDLALGLSTAIAVLCHEVPHEFGDVAIMLSAGWSVKKVALLQLASAATAFVGLYIGISVASNEEARHWIFIVAAGMFLYVAMCNVIPELIAMYQEERKKGIFLAANIGFILGVVFMLLLAIFEEYITV